MDNIATISFADGQLGTRLRCLAIANLSLGRLDDGRLIYSATDDVYPRAGVVIKVVIAANDGTLSPRGLMLDGARLARYEQLAMNAGLIPLKRVTAGPYEWKIDDRGRVVDGRAGYLANLIAAEIAVGGSPASAWSKFQNGADQYRRKANGRCWTERDAVARWKACLRQQAEMRQTAGVKEPTFPVITEGRDAALKRQRVSIKRIVRNAFRHMAAQLELEQRKASLPPLKDGEKRKAIAAIKADIALKLGMREFPKIGERWLISGSQGSGKTTVTLQELVMMPRGVVHVYLPLRLKIEEVTAQLRELARKAGRDDLSIIPIYGYGADAPGQSHLPEAEREKMCRRSNAVIAAASKGISIPSNVCRHCPFFDECLTQKQNQMLETFQKFEGPKIYVLHHEFLSLPFNPAPRPDFVIVDEDFETASNGRFDLERARAFIMESPVAEAAIDITEALAIYDSVVGILKTPEPLKAFSLLDRKVLHEDLKKVRGYLSAIDRATTPKLSDGYLRDEEIIEHAKSLPDRWMLKVRWLFKQIEIALSVKAYERRSIFNSIILKKATDTDSGIETVVAYVHWLKPMRIAKRTPVLALDGTGNIERHRARWGQTMEEINIRIERDADVTWCPLTFSKRGVLAIDQDGQSLGPSYVARADLLQKGIVCAVEREVQANRRTYVCTNAPIEKMLLQKHLIDKFEQAIDGKTVRMVMTGHFGKVRGLNAYECCETAIIVGREQMAVEKAEALARSYLESDPEPFTPAKAYVKVERCMRMRDGSGRAQMVDEHPDRRVQKLIIEPKREAEFVQAVDRVRAIFNPRRIILLSPLVVDITVDRVVESVQDLIEGRSGTRVDEALAACGGRVLPTTQAEFARLAPMVAENVDQARAILRHAKENGRLQQAMPANMGLVRVEYRREGGNVRGPMSAALVAVSAGDDVRAVLEGVVGPTSRFEIIEVIRQPAAPVVHVDDHGDDDDGVDENDRLGQDQVAGDQADDDHGRLTVTQPAGIPAAEPWAGSGRQAGPGSAAGVARAA